MPKLTLPIRGMHCTSCEIMIEEHLTKVNGVAKVSVNHTTCCAEVYFDGAQPEMPLLEQAVSAAGYQIGEPEQLGWISKNWQDYKNLLAAIIIVAVLYLLGKASGIFNLNVATENASLGVVLLVGLVAGVSTCMALLGGLVLALSTRHAELHPEATAQQKFRPHVYFNLGRIGGYAVLGGLIGLVGAALTPSARVIGLLTVVVGAVMIALGLKLIEIFPRLKNKTIALPKALSRWVGINRNQSEYSHKNALITGALTFFLPCGFTQAMQLYAVSTGSFTQGAAIMGLFALGSTPGLLGIGWLTSWFKGRAAKLFFAVAGVIVIVLGWVNIASGSKLVGARVAGDTNQQITEVQEVRMTQDFEGYTPNTFIVKKGKTVKWVINSKTPFSCAAYLVVPKYGISQVLRTGENVISFTPTETGEIPFSCSMNMYRGKFIVVD